MSADPDFPLPDVTWPPAQPFWAGAALHELWLPRCQSCGSLNAAGETSCRRCDGATLAWERLSGDGTVYSWTYVRRAFLPQFAGEVPFLTGLVGVVEDPAVRIVTRLVECEPSDMRIDLPVEVVFTALPFAGAAAPVIAPYFRPRSG